jgi:phosphoribosylglycinamide formyltransferase-1
MLRIGWMSTGRGPTSLALLQAVCADIAEARLDARISFVLTNRGRGEAAQSDRFQDYVLSQQLPLVAVSSSAFRRSYSGEDWRTTFDRTMSDRIREYDVDLIFLAGYMLIVSDFLCTKYLLLNLHPALPGGPTGTWQEVMVELARTGALTAGAMVHIVTPELDRGPVVSYFSFSLQGEPFTSLRSSGNVQSLADAIREQEVRREFPLILTTLRALSTGDVTISARQAYDKTGVLLQRGLDLSDRVERQLTGPDR